MRHEHVTEMDQIAMQLGTRSGALNFIWAC